MQQGGGILNASALLAQVKNSVQCQKIKYLTEAALDIYNLMEIVEKHLFSIKAINECARQKIASHRIKFHAASNPRTINSCLEAIKIIIFLKMNSLVEKADTFLIKALQNYVLPSHLQEILDSKLHEISLANKQSIINEGHLQIGSLQSYRKMAKMLYTEKNKFERESGNAINMEISPNDLLDILICHYDSLIHHLIEKPDHPTFKKDFQKKSNSQEGMGNPAFFMDIQNEEDPELMFLTHQNISNCPSEAIDIADTLTKRYTQNRKAKNLPLNLKKCILNCGKNHPFQSLRFCPLAYTKTKEEILNILKKVIIKGVPTV